MQDKSNQDLADQELLPLSQDTVTNSAPQEATQFDKTYEI